MRGSKWAALAVLLGAALILPTGVRAHGSLPISQQIMWRDGDMLVPAAYWGLFIGTDGGSWRWICEEAINSNQARQMALVLDGTLYATDRTGLTVSRDHGCTWTPVASGVNALQIATVVGDPVRPRAWVLGNSSDDSENGVWFSDDTGQSWQRAYSMVDYLPSGLRISDDGQTVVVGSATLALPRKAVLHVSTNGGKTFTSRTLSFMLDGQPLMFFKPTWIDPAVPAA